MLVHYLQRLHPTLRFFTNLAISVILNNHATAILYILLQFFTNLAITVTFYKPAAAILFSEFEILFFKTF